jgi:hypothetical protein
MRIYVAVSALLIPFSSVLAETNSFDYESISATSSTAIGFSASKLSPTNGPKPTTVFVTVEDNDVRFRTDGTSPTTTEGHKLAMGATLTISGQEEIQHFKAIGVSGTGTLKVTYER